MTLAQLQNAEFVKACYNDASLNRMVQAGYSSEEIIVQLVKEKHQLAEKAMKLVLIVPDGSIRVWTCPHHLIPDPV